jgi:hypothetical protein
MKLRKHKKVSIKAIKKVRYRVKQALVKRAEVKDHRPTVPQIQSWFSILNKGLFEGKLVMPPIEIKKLRTCRAQCIMNWDGRTVKCPYGEIPSQSNHPSITFQIQMNFKFDTWKDFIETLAHEMVHLYQMTVEKDRTANHNTSFYRWRKKFKQFGLGLSL